VQDRPGMNHILFLHVPPILLIVVL
jgi:hypothetical protein